METLDLQPPVLEWRVYRNDSTVLTLVLVDSNDVALDLTDWEFAGKVREFPKSTDVLATMEIVKNENILTIALDTADLAQISHFDVEGTNETTGKTSTVVRGMLFVEEDVTR